MLIFTQSTKGHDTLFVDSRDGKTYPIVQMGDLLWFGTNLSYETPTSWCVEEIKVKDCADGNYYYNTDLESLCPQGWRVATWTDWDETLKYQAQERGMSLDSITYDSLDFTLWSRVLLEGFNFNLMYDTLGLNFKATGFVEGASGKAKKKIKYSLASFWVIDKKANDPRMHIHMNETGLNKHNHSSSTVSGKPSKMRRFAVRCVTDRE